MTACVNKMQFKRGLCAAITSSDWFWQEFEFIFFKKSLPFFEHYLLDVLQMGILNLHTGSASWQMATFKICGMWATCSDKNKTFLT